LTVKIYFPSLIFVFKKTPHNSIMSKLLPNRKNTVRRVLKGYKVDAKKHLLMDQIQKKR